MTPERKRQKVKAAGLIKSIKLRKWVEKQVLNIHKTFFGYDLRTNKPIDLLEGLCPHCRHDVDNTRECCPHCKQSLKWE